MVKKLTGKNCVVKPLAVWLFTFKVSDLILSRVFSMSLKLSHHVKGINQRSVESCEGFLRVLGILCLGKADRGWVWWYKPTVIRTCCCGDLAIARKLNEAGILKGPLLVYLINAYLCMQVVAFISIFI